VSQAAIDFVHFDENLRQTKDHLESTISSVLDATDSGLILLNESNSCESTTYLGTYLSWFCETLGRLWKPWSLNYQLKQKIVQLTQHAITNLRQRIEALEEIELADRSHREALIYQTSRYFNESLLWRQRLLHHVRVQLTHHLEEFDQADLDTALYAQQAEDCRENFFLDSERSLVLLWPFVSLAYLDEPVIAMIQVDSYLKNLLKGRLEHYRSVEESLATFPRAQYKLSPTSERWTLTTPSADQRMRFEKTAFKRGTYFQQSIRDYQAWLDTNLEEISYRILFKILTENLGIQLKFGTKQIRLGSIKKFLSYNPRYLQPLSDALKRAGDHDVDRLVLDPIRIARQDRSSGITLEMGVDSSASSLDRSGLTASLQASFEDDDIQQRRRPKWVQNTDEASAVVRPENSVRLEARAPLRARYQETLAQRAQSQPNPESPDFVESTFVPGGWSNETDCFIRGVFLLDRQFRPRNKAEVWSQLKEAYREIKLRQDGIPNEVPQSSQGGGSARDLRSGKKFRTLHEPHGLALEHRPHYMLKRIKNIFEDFGWTPENLGI
jgi:hypothetical protein